MTVLILGAGMAGLSLAHFLKEDSILLEKEALPGGLCRSFLFNGISYDIGSHILFSKNQEILKLMLGLLETNTIRRSSKIFHNGVLVKYPFENDLGSLAPAEKDYCLNEFLNNPYEDYEARNMLQFFLKTFGEGITRLYLQPYNEKIWKYDPAFMDIQMVERIPKPPKEDVIKGAEGISTEGYLHQLYFQYPKTGGIQQLVEKFRDRISGKSKVLTGVTIKKITKSGSMFKVETDKGIFEAGTLVNCMPLHELAACMEWPAAVKEASGKLKFNSIHIAVVQAKKWSLGDNLSINFADSKIIFHRLTRINFLGPAYSLPGDKVTLLAEITFRPGSYVSALSPQEVMDRVLADLRRLGIVGHEDVIATEIRTFKYAYVIYDLDHRQNTDIVLAYLSSQGIHSCGRFAEFEYLNMDAVVERSLRLAQKLNAG